MTSVDRYLRKRYERGRYDCLHFAAEVWRDLTGEELRERLGGLLGTTGARHVRSSHVRAFRRLPTPEEPCLVVFQRARVTPHVGVFLRGRILHLREEGAAFQPLELAQLGWTSARCYR